MHLLPLVLLVGCADYDLSAGDYAKDDTAGATDADDSAVDDSADTEEATDPAWYVVRADLTVAGGVATPDAASISVEIIDADLERISCVVAVSPDQVTAAEAEPDSETVWWAVPVRSANAPCATLPDTLLLGVGPLHPDARARLGSVGHDAIADSLFGAWLQADGGDITVFGYAGTASDLLGDDTAVLPPPDGLYRLAPLYVVPLPE
ncbi:MAG: hypothetical protein Q8P18_16580 [Pseudomonadota bacterium]|nr:hypothetical protein [Pseudomonadota bacterium]